MHWINTIFSDGSRHFVSNPTPKLGEIIKVKLRVIKGAPVDRVILRRKYNGGENISDMSYKGHKKGYDYYEGDLTINEPFVHYHFYVISGQQIYYYNQYEVTDYIPTEVYDFRIVADYENPEWVSKSVFYQIFPDRFYNGNPDNDVQTGEYTFDGHETIKMDWTIPAKDYDDVHCLDFYGGDLEGVEAKIPYFKEMGINAIYINPIFFAATSHKYDCLDYFQVDPHLGGDQAFESLMKALHDNDMRLIVDVSINHTGTAHKWFNKEATFFDQSIGAFHNPESRERDYYYFEEDNKYHAWFDIETLPTLNYETEELRDILYRSEDSVVKKWLKAPYNIDGWRFDVANTMARIDDRQMHHDVWPAIRKSIKGVNDQAYIVGEHWSDCNENLMGDEWDSAMNYYGFGRPIRHFLGEQDLYLQRDKDLNARKYTLTAKNMSHRIMQHLARLPHVIINNQMNLFDSHDVSRLHNNPDINFEKYRAAVIQMYMMPGTPNVYYGDEVGIEGHLRSVEGCRYAFPWEESRQKLEYKELYKTMGHLKIEENVFHDGSFRIIYNEGLVFACARFDEEHAYIAISSMSDQEETCHIDIRPIQNSVTYDVHEIFDKELNVNIQDGLMEVQVAKHTTYLIKLEN